MRNDDEKAMLYLLALAESIKENPEDKPSLSRVADQMGVNRSTVQRAFIDYRKNGILDENYYLTKKGKAYAEPGRQQAERLRKLLNSHGIEKQKVVLDSLAIIKNCSKETAMLLSNMGITCDSCRHYKAARADRWKGFSGDQFKKKLGILIEDGTYEADFHFLTEICENVREYSMANEGFCRPALLKIQDGEGSVVLRRRTISHQSASGSWYQGEADKVEYEQSDKWISAEVLEDLISLPLNAFWISYQGDYSRFRGMIRLKMSCSAGEKAMGNRTALLEVRWWKKMPAGEKTEKR